MLFPSVKLTWTDSSHWSDITDQPRAAVSASFRSKAGIQSLRGRFVDKEPAVYILASKRNGTLNIGVTSNLVKRIWEHKNDLIAGFTKRYGVHRLVWYELHDSMESAIAREKRLKDWKRAWKLDLIEETNPDWQDLYSTIV